METGVGGGNRMRGVSSFPNTTGEIWPRRHHYLELDLAIVCAEIALLDVTGEDSHPVRVTVAILADLVNLS